MRRACRYLPVNTDTRPTQPNALAATAALPPAGDDPSPEIALEEDPPVEAVFGVEAICPKGDPKPPATTSPVRSDPATPASGVVAKENSPDVAGVVVVASPWLTLLLPTQSARSLASNA